MKLRAKVGISVASLVVALVIGFVGGNLTDEQVDNLYYCQVENSLQECSSLDKYGVPDARCIFPTPVNGKSSDICTSGGVRQAWKPARDFVDVIIPKNAVVVKALQDCNIEHYNVTEDIIGNCSRQVYNYSDCIKYITNKTKKVCVNWSKYNETYSCKKGTKIVLNNKTVCKPKGFMINYSRGRVYKIPYSCCGYYNESPYKEFVGKQLISCKQEVKGICNPLIQQTSPDYTRYDEPGRIFVITQKGIEPHLVGAHKYFLDHDINIGKVEAIK